MPEASPNLMGALDRYENDAVFHQLVHGLCMIVEVGALTPEDVRQGLALVEHLIATGSVVQGRNRNGPNAHGGQAHHGTSDKE